MGHIDSSYSSFSNMKSSISHLVKLYPRPQRRLFKYGTAGFRENAEILDSVFLRMGMLSVLRSMVTSKGVGLMVTASHNPVADNGLKAVEPDGGMLEQDWEAFATNLVNCNDDNVVNLLAEIGTLVGVNLDSMDISDGSNNARVFIGRDTRPHSARLAALAIRGIEALCGKVIDIGVVTTPQLHHVVRCFNLPREQHFATEQGYYTKMSRAYHLLLRGRTPSSPLIIDAAYGVGGPKFAELLRVINMDNPRALWCDQVRNSPTGTGVPLSLLEEAKQLNNDIGAEHVQKKLQLPFNQTVKLPEEAGFRFASFDGDADRIVYFRARKPDGHLNLFDGDKIACLFAFFLKKQLASLPASLTNGLRMGCVQTAYANGAAQRYVREILNLEGFLTKTGVKHLHRKALEYDIAIYFEANGHGTVLFAPSFIDRIRQALLVPCGSSNALNEAEAVAAENLMALEQLINQATGDAISDCLAVEAILCIEGIGLDDWDAFYSDLPSRQLKCSIRNKDSIITSEDETRVVEPRDLQAAISAASKRCDSGRAFVRPSGTEDAVRIYTEAATSEQANTLALEVEQAIIKHADGVS